MKNDKKPTLKPGRMNDARKPSSAVVRLVSPIDELGIAIENENGARLLERTRCRLSMKLENGADFEAAAKIVWVRRTQDGCVVGIEFVHNSNDGCA